MGSTGVSEARLVAAPAGRFGALNLHASALGSAEHLSVGGHRRRRRATVLLLFPAAQARTMQVRRANCGAVRYRLANDSRCIHSSAVRTMATVGRPVRMLTPL